jgi:hypothetical protein
MKRTTEERPSLDGNRLPESKKRALSSEEAAARFRDGLFDPAQQKQYTESYAKSSPYVFLCIRYSNGPDTNIF